MIADLARSVSLRLVFTDSLHQGQRRTQILVHRLLHCPRFDWLIYCRTASHVPLEFDYGFRSSGSWHNRCIQHAPTDHIQNVIAVVAPSPDVYHKLCFHLSRVDPSSFYMPVSLTRHSSRLSSLQKLVNFAHGADI